MFDRFTEHARRAVFFAHYEASTLGSSWIDTEHLLLGLVREDKVLSGRLGSGAGETIRKGIEAGLPKPIRRITTTDMPLTGDAKSALSLAAEEAKKLSHNAIDCGHLVLGLLQIENCAAAKLLRERGIDYESYVELVRNTFSPDPKVRRAVEGHRPSPPQPAASSLTPSVVALEGLLDATVQHLSAYSDSYGDQRLKRRPWTRKEAFGHLVDWAVTHQQWFARALTESSLAAQGYPADTWVSAQQYRNYAWQNIIDLWVSMNRFLIHVLAQIPEDKLNLMCRIGIQEPIPLSKVIERYVQHCEDVAGQILARL